MAQKLVKSEDTMDSRFLMGLIKKEEDMRQVATPVQSKSLQVMVPNIID